MEQTTTMVILSEALQIFISLLFTALSGFAISWLRTSSTAKKYKLNNDRIEATIANAIDYAENATKKASMDGLAKKQYAIKYIEGIDPSIIREKGDSLELMIDRKVYQKFGINKTPLQKTE